MTKTWNMLFGPLMAILACLILPVGLASAETNAATLAQDKAACTGANDAVRCEAVYDYLSAERERAEGKKADRFLADMRLMADTGCAAGNGWLCTEIGYSHSEGTNGRAQDNALSLQYHLRACDLGNGLGCARAGQVYAAGRGVVTDKDAASRFYVKGCGLGSSTACQYEAYRLLVQRTADIPYSEDSISTLQDRCDDTALVGAACVELGIAHFYGHRGLEEDEAAARNLWGKACGRVSDAIGCYLRALHVLSDTDMADRHSPENLSGIQALYRGCWLGELAACEFMIIAGAEAAWDYDDVVAQGLYGRCLDKPSINDCKLAGDAFMPGKFPDHAIKGDYAPGKAMRAWMAACREFNVRCVEAANLYLGNEAVAAKAPNLAIGVLETACERGDPNACARRDEVVAETGGVQGSYIDPMLIDDERFLLARFDIESGETERGRETMQWLAFLGHTHAEMALASAYQNGLLVVSRPPPGVVRELPFGNDEQAMIDILLESAARKGVPEAAMRVAVIKHNENDHTGSDSYEASIARALYLGADGAQEFYDAVKANNKARIDARVAAVREMHRQNIESRNNMDQQTVQRAWDQYYERQKEKAALEGGQVCGTVYGPGNSTYRTCMSRATAMKHYRGNF